MEHLDIILILMALLAGLYSVAGALKISYPILLVIAGLVIGLFPGLPVIQITPDIVFLLFLPPLLFDAGRHMPWHDFKKNRYPIGRLAIGLVLFTTAGVAICAHYLIPGFTWPLAFILGAIVSPPDAVAATSAIKGLNLPKRLVTILEGESLVNDASALIAYRYAVAALVSGTFVFWQAALKFVLVSGGGIIIGLMIGHAFLWLQKKYLRDSTVETIATLMLPFIAYLTAEHLHASGILSVVVAGLLLSWRAHEIFSFQTRLQMNSFWDTLIFLLNGFVFILIGLQLPVIVDNIAEHSLPEMIGYGLFISAVVIMIRMIWIFPVAHFSDWWHNILNHDKRITSSNKHLLVIGWSGMRGVISLATALALPLALNDGTEFPQRDVILFITFVVILVTLVFQGLTLPLLIRWLGVEEPKEKEAIEERRLQLVMANSALNFINNTLSKDIPEQALEEARTRLKRKIDYLNGILSTEKDSHPHTSPAIFAQYLESEKAIITHQRALLVEMHKKGAFDEDVLRRIEQDLDARSLTLSGRINAFYR